MGLPVIIFSEVTGARLTIGGLTVLDRLLVTLHRAGCGPITLVSPGPPPDLRRTRALGIPFGGQSRVTATTGPVLLARGDLLTQIADVQEVIRTQGRLARADGTPLPLGVIGSGELPALATLDRNPQLVQAGPVTGEIADQSAARDGGRRLWASLTSSSDGLVDRHFNRPCGRWLSRLLVHTGVTPNQVSLFSILIGLVAAWFLADGVWTQVVLGALLFQLSAIIDCVDGDLARVVFKESRLGKWLDIGGDQVVHAAVFIGIAVGLGRGGTKAPVAWLAASAVGGATISFAVILRGMLGNGIKANGRLQSWIDRATNRDFSVLVLALALAGALEWFLWLAAIGSHIFWIVALLLQYRSSASNAPAGTGPTQ